ncbi:MAG TPA: tetratricopeptide repeat protein [Acidobacteriota bacterium]|nr:tetratricopeptide repeat protein [Acidobacteriota bacterium]
MMKLFQVLTVSFLISGSVWAAGETDRSQAYYHFLLGSMKERSREYASAIQEYREALKYDPKASEVYARLAELYIQTNRMDEAIQDANRALEKNPNNKEAHRMLGQIYLERLYMSDMTGEEVNKAIKEFQEVLRIDPADDWATLSLGQLYLQSNRAGEAVALISRYLEKDPNSSAALLAAASAYQQLQQYDKAIQHLSRYLELNPSNPNTLQQISELHERRGDFARALEFMERAYQADPGNVPALRKYVDLLEKNQRFPEAVRILQERVESEPQKSQWKILLSKALQRSGDQDKAEAILKEEIAKNSEDLDLHLALIQIYEDGRKFPEALAQLKEMINRLPGNTSMEEPERKGTEALIYSHKGYAEQQLKDYENSIQSYRKARELVPVADRSKIDFYIALNYRSQKKWDEAIQMLDAILKADANDADSWELLSLIYEEKGDSSNSDKIIEHLIQTHPDLPEYYILKAERLQQRDKYAESAGYLDGLLKKFPSNDQIYFLMGAAQERLKKWDEAEEAFKQAISINPQNANALNYLGYMLIDRGERVEESIEYVRKALEMDKNNGAFLDSLGWGYFKINKFDLAEDNLKRALELLEDNAVVHDHLGDLYFKQGKFREAMQHWESAAKSDSKEIDGAYIQKKIEDTRKRMQ